MTTIKQATAATVVLREFINPQQLEVLGDMCGGEEREYFKAKLVEYAGRVRTMPKTYGQDGLGLDAVAYLHYFTGSCDWYITERDVGPGQHQAFGVANLGHGPELGYISIVELLAAGAELDIHFTPARLRDIEKARP